MSHAPNTRRKCVKETQPTAVFYADSTPETVSADVKKKGGEPPIFQLQYSTHKVLTPSDSFQTIYAPDEDGRIYILPVTAAVVEGVEAGAPAPLPELSSGPQGRIGAHRAYFCLIAGYCGKKTAITYRRGNIYLSGCTQAIRVHGLKNTGTPLPVVDWEPLHDALEGGVA